MPFSRSVLLAELKKINFGRPSRAANAGERHVATSLNSLIRQFQEAMNYEIEEDGELIHDPSGEEVDFTVIIEPLRGPDDYFSFEYIDRVLKYKDQGHSFESVSIRFAVLNKTNI